MNRLFVWNEVDRRVRVVDPEAQAARNREGSWVQSDWIDGVEIRQNPDEEEQIEVWAANKEEAVKAFQAVTAFCEKGEAPE